jgi:transposase
MESWVERIVEKEKARRGVPLEVKRIGNRHYLYMSTSQWDKELKRRRKLSRYIGRITKRGVIEADRTKHDARLIYEYGNSRFVTSLIEDLVNPLREAFPEDYREIIAMGIVKLLQPTPLKLVKSRWEKLHLSTELDASLSPNTLSEKLRRVGVDVIGQKQFFEHLLKGNGVLVFDMSSIFSYSENLKLAEKGYNSEGLYLKQINFVLLISQTRRLPVMIKPVPGSVRDIKALKTAINEVFRRKCILVLDRGPASYTIPEMLKEKEVSFVLPMKRNFRIVDYGLLLRKSFVFMNRGINWGRKRTGKGFLYMFEDVKLRAEEETNFIERVREGRKNRSQLERERKKFGKIAILSNLDRNGEEVYKLYKNRQRIEVVFDALKNELENDKTYLSDDDAIRGYFFVSFISLYLYCRILELLRERGYVGKVSVNELLFELSKVYLVIHNDGRVSVSEIPAKVERLDEELKLNLFPKR